MRRFYTILGLILLAQPVLAAELSPIQQYLQSEAGYAPPMAPQPAPVAYAPQALQARTSPSSAQPITSADAEGHINSGVSGMNN